MKPGNDERGTNPGERDIEGPALEQQDWDAVVSGEITPQSAPDNGDLRYQGEKPGDLPGEDDDNPFQESDEALPDDKAEEAMKR